MVDLDDDGREVFDSLQARLHPAESRVKMLAEQTAGRCSRAFDLLAEVKTKLRKRPSRSGRERLKEMIAQCRGRKIGLRLGWLTH